MAPESRSDTEAEGLSATSTSTSPAPRDGGDRPRTSAADEDRIEEVLATLAEDLKKVGLAEDGPRSEL